MEQGLDTTPEQQGRTIVNKDKNEDSVFSTDEKSSEVHMEDDLTFQGVTDSPSLSTKEIEKHEDSTNKAKASAKVFKSFHQRLVELKAFKAKNGHCRVPSKFESNPSLAAWCANLKQSYRLMQQGRKPILKLTEEKLNSLEHLGFEWKYSGRTPKGPTTSKTSIEESSLQHDEEENKLSQDNTSTSSMNPEKPTLVSSTEDSSDDASIHDHDKSTSISLSGDNKVEKNLKRKVEDMSTSGIQEGDIVAQKKTQQRERGNSKKFHERLQELKEYKEKHGHCRVSRNDKNYYSLGSWCYNIRGSYRANQKLHHGDEPILSQDKISALNEIGFDWTLKEPRQLKSFEQRLDDLKAFKALFGHTRVPSGYEKNPSLAYWCNNLRNAFKMKKTGKKQYISLTQERIDALVAIGFEFGKKHNKMGKTGVNLDEKLSNVLSSENDCKQKVQKYVKPRNDTKEEKENGEPQIGDKTLKKLEGGVGPILFI